MQREPGSFVMAGRPRRASPHHDRLPMASLLTPEAALAVHAHRIAVAVDAERHAIAARSQAEEAARAEGFPVDVWLRAMDLMNADPDAMAALERHTSVLLLAVRAGIDVEEVRVFEATTDQSAEDRAQRIRDEGFHAAIVGRPADGGGYAKAADRAVWTGGWHDFKQVLAAAEAAEAVAAATGALSSSVPAETVSALFMARQK